MFLKGLSIHCVFLYSIFDIYFKSPIVKNISPYQPVHDHVADRLVLFIIDGLRAESFIKYDTMQYLRTVASTRGRWGISNTRVPTESRPGHVAVIAGFYEDPSAILKGWKENPVDFDSVFNQSLYTWCWGTYDILDIFTKGTVDDHIKVKKMDPYDQTFSTDKNTSHLDAWVFDNVKDFFLKAKDDEKLHAKKLIFFLHLLGTDTSGHTHKPKTKNFLTTLRHVDAGIKEIENIIRDFYGDDGKTTFLMTSDHGMTDWGSHGAGDDHETQTPFVIWGSGVNQDENTDFKGFLPEDRRHDINQADIAPLISSILSIPVPVNSVGKLPADLLNMTLENKSKAIYANSRQLGAKYSKKRTDVENTAISALYKPFGPLTEEKYNAFIAHMEKLLAEKDYETLMSFSESLMDLSLQGLNYYHNYYQYPLLIAISLAFGGWILFLLRKLLLQNINTQTDAEVKKRNRTNVFLQKSINLGFAFIGLTSVMLICVQSLPFQYNIYFLLPVLLWWKALSPIDIWVVLYLRLKSQQYGLKLALEIIVYIAGCIAMGLSFTYRWMLSVPLLGIGLWPVISSVRKHSTIKTLFIWSTSCFLLSIFTFIPVVGKQVFIEQVVLSGVIWLCIYIYYIMKYVVKFYKTGLEPKREVVLSIVQAIVLLISLQNIYVQSKRFDESTPVSFVYQTIAWIIALLSMFLPLFHSRRLICRVMAVCTSMFTFYILLSVLHEGLFLVTLIINILCWIIIEFSLSHSSKAQITSVVFNEEHTASREGHRIIAMERCVSRDDFRRAFFFLLYMITAFFGTGNISSLNSFEVRWVTCFVTSFQPFLITGLILTKTLIPFICVATCFRAVQYVTKAPTGFLNMIVLVYSNIMGIQLLFYVTNIGSWLEIGTSISQYVIVQVITLFIVIIHQLALILTDINLYIVAQNTFGTKTKVY